MRAFDGNLERHSRSMSFSSGFRRKNWFAHPVLGKVEVGRLSIVGYSIMFPSSATTRTRITYCSICIDMRKASPGS